MNRPNLIRDWGVIGLCVASLWVGGCQKSNSPPPHDENPARSSETTEIPEQWLGRWDGPEGTFLEISKMADHYGVLIQDLDGPRIFIGTPDRKGIRFERDGKVQFIHAGDGQASGMKWLADKKHCLMTRPGEGWCRD
jgi:hypothetical protein